MDLLLLLKGLILGLVEGATEFIPVSSTGHLILAGDLLDYTSAQAEVFFVFIQLGAILAILWLYRDKVMQVATTWHRNQTNLRFVINLIIAFFPAAFIGLLTYDWITEYLFSPITVAGALVVGGIGILVIEGVKPRTKVEEIDAISPLLALGIGLAQVLSLFPGVSRSGATIMGAYAMGLSRRASTEFSFFLAIPIMIAATLFDLWSNRDILSVNDVPMFTVGFVVSFLSALIVVQKFLSFVSSNTFRPFAWYRIIFGLIVLGVYWYFL